MRKALNERKNELLDKMTAIVENAQREGRAISEEENATFENYEREVKDIENTINAENRLGGIERPIVDEKDMTLEMRERRTFENMIRNVGETTVADGKVTIPTTIAKKIIEMITDSCPIFAMAERYNIKGNLSIPLEDSGSSTLEMTYADEFSSATSGKVVLKAVNLGEFLGRALAKVSLSLVNNSQFDIVSYVEKKIAQKAKKFIEKELLVGTSMKILGMQGVTQKVELAKNNAITPDELIDLQETIYDEYQSDCIWIMNRETRKAIRKLKDSHGDYLLEKDLTAKWGYKLLGKDVYTTDVMDKLGSNQKTVAYYGDMTGLAVKISEDINIQVLREKYAEEHALGVLAFVGLDSKVQNVQKIAKLTTPAGA